MKLVGKDKLLASVATRAGDQREVSDLILNFFSEWTQKHGIDSISERKLAPFQVF